MNKLRMRFSKTGRAIYISHLDLMHTMQRAFSRAGLRIKYSEGFNPHPLISIALPLSVGTASRCELMDFRLDGTCELAYFLENLNVALPEGIEVLEVYEPARKAAELKWLELEGRFEYDQAKPSSMVPLLEAFYNTDSILISKKTKRGFSAFDLVSAISSVSFTAADDSVSVHTVVSAQEPTFNPDLFCEALHQLDPTLSPDFASFTRVETYDASMNLFR